MVQASGPKGLEALLPSARQKEQKDQIHSQFIKQFGDLDVAIKSKVHSHSCLYGLMTHSLLLY